MAKHVKSVSVKFRLSYLNVRIRHYIVQKIVRAEAKNSPFYFTAVLFPILACAEICNKNVSM